MNSSKNYCGIEIQTPVSESEDGVDLMGSGRSPQHFSLEDYDSKLDAFDIAVCEAIAVSQAAANRCVAPHHGYGSYIFACLCNHAVEMIRAAPRSRWVRSDFEHWAFSSVAGHARAIIEGQLLFLYLIETPVSTEAWSARLNVMHLNDCTRRIKFFTNLGSSEAEIAAFESKAEEIEGRLKANSFFNSLPDATQKRCLAGDFLMISSRDEMLEKAGWDRSHFNAAFDLLSNHTHILPMSFYSMEPNGRGTGIANDADGGYIAMFLEICADALRAVTDSMVNAFPDVANVRLGKKSTFSPGPHENVAADSQALKRKVRVHKRRRQNKS